MFGQYGFELTLKANIVNFWKINNASSPALFPFLISSWLFFTERDSIFQTILTC